MPTYQYACTECENELEAVQKFTDDSLTDCPQCTGRLRKVFSAVGVVFKGSGFYRNDSRSEKSAEKSKAPASSSSSDSGSSATSSSTTPSSSSSESSTAAPKKESSSSSPAKSGSRESAA